jgi:hypothetical protein
MADYTRAARLFRDRLLAEEELLESVVAGFHAAGRVYFGGHRSGYIEADTTQKTLTEIPALSRAEFLRFQFEYQRGEPPSGPEELAEAEEELIFEDEAARDDAFRHAVVVDLTDAAHPVTRPLSAEEAAKYGHDHVFTWKGIAAFAADHPDGDLLALHGDTADGLEFFLPLPAAATQGGGRRRGRSRSRVRGRKSRRQTKRK